MARELEGAAEAQMPLEHDVAGGHTFSALESVNVVAHGTGLVGLYPVERKEVAVLPVEIDLALRQHLGHRSCLFRAENG